MTDNMLTYLQTLHAEYSVRCETLRQDLAALCSAEASGAVADTKSGELLEEMFVEAEHLLNQLAKAIEGRSSNIVRH